MADLIRANGTSETISGPLTLSRMQDLVGGYIELVRIGPDGEVLIVDEEGLLKRKSVNPLATALYQGTPARHNGIIVGDAIRCVCRDIGTDDERYE